MDENKDLKELEKLLRERLNDNECCWKLGWTSESGRGVFANKHIQAGQLVFSDSHIIIGPRGVAEGSAICICCNRSGLPLKPCSEGCRLPLCSSQCQTIHSTSPECRMLVALGVSKGDSWSPELYRALTPFRGLNIRNEDKKIIRQLQAHPKNGLSPEINLLKRGVISELTKEQIDWMDLCCRVLDAVAFQAVIDDFESKQSAVRGLYPLAGLMNHSCRPNTRQVFDNGLRLNLIAVKDITEDEEVTTSYCPLLWSTSVRIPFLQKTKHFTCNCARCQDPTEMGSFLAGLKCSCGGIVLPSLPHDSKCNWMCNMCDRSLSSGQAMLTSTLLASGKVSNSLSLPPHNYLALNDNLRNILNQRNEIKDMGINELVEREDKIKYILKIVEKLGLGECRTRGLLLGELYRTDKEMQMRSPLQIYRNLNAEM